MHKEGGGRQRGNRRREGRSEQEREEERGGGWGGGGGRKQKRERGRERERKELIRDGNPRLKFFLECREPKTSEMTKCVFSFIVCIHCVHWSNFWGGKTIFVFPFFFGGGVDPGLTSLYQCLETAQCN